MINHVSGKEVTYTCELNEYDNIIDGCWRNFQEVKCASRYHKLTWNFMGDVTDVENFRHFLPPEYKYFAEDIEKLWNSLANFFDLSSKYSLSGIYITNACFGCQNDCAGQQDHMECNTGCLHDPNICFFCLS